jgi:hypothetical protein
MQALSICSPGDHLNANIIVVRYGLLGIDVEHIVVHVLIIFLKKEEGINVLLNNTVEWKKFL